MKHLNPDDLSEDVLAAAIAAAKRRWSDATIARMLSTLRGFTRWLYRTGRITTPSVEGLSSRAGSGPARSNAGITTIIPGYRRWRSTPGAVCAAARAAGGRSVGLYTTRAAGGGSRPLRPSRRALNARLE
ncbi:MAG: site-specific integrase [Acidimicrobiia bacterium]